MRQTQIWFISDVSFLDSLLLEITTSLLQYVSLYSKILWFICTAVTEHLGTFIFTVIDERKVLKTVH